MLGIHFVKKVVVCGGRVWNECLKYGVNGTHTFERLTEEEFKIENRKVGLEKRSQRQKSNTGLNVFCSIEYNTI